jgi:hypothetical protein
MDNANADPAPLDEIAPNARKGFTNCCWKTTEDAAIVTVRSLVWVVTLQSLRRATPRLDAIALQATQEINATIVRLGIIDRTARNLVLRWLGESATHAIQNVMVVLHTEQRLEVHAVLANTTKLLLVTVARDAYLTLIVRFKLTAFASRRMTMTMMTTMMRRMTPTAKKLTDGLLEVTALNVMQAAVHQHQETGNVGDRRRSTATHAKSWNRLEEVA